MIKILKIIAKAFESALNVLINILSRTLFSTKNREYNLLDDLKSLFNKLEKRIINENQFQIEKKNILQKLKKFVYNLHYIII